MSTLTVHTDVVCPDEDCEFAITCDVCEVTLCSEHSTEFASCAGSKFLIHHEDCVDECDECTAARWEDANEDRAIEQWKGMW